MLPRTWILLCGMGLAVCMTSPAMAATIAISTDKATYNTGEIVTIAVDLDSGGATASTALVDLLITGPVSNIQIVSTPQLTSFGGTANWSVGANQGTCITSTVCRVVDQISPNLGSPPPEDGGPRQAIVTLIFDAVGDLNISTVDGDAFFGAANQSASATIVPEPGTASLLAFGLLSLAARRRRS
ncbi:MAG: PEP-CTERM sorting domain-containing protein [Myxococcota bacterium]